MTHSETIAKWEKFKNAVADVESIVSGTHDLYKTPQNRAYLVYRAESDMFIATLYPIKDDMIIFVLQKEPIGMFDIHEQITYGWGRVPEDSLIQNFLSWANEFHPEN